jgi:hypothetical protein
MLRLAPIQHDGPLIRINSRYEIAKRLSDIHDGLSV